MPTMGCFFGLAFKKYGMPLSSIIKVCNQYYILRFYCIRRINCNTGCYYRCALLIIITDSKADKSEDS